MGGWRGAGRVCRGGTGQAACLFWHHRMGSYWAPCGCVSPWPSPSGTQVVTVTTPVPVAAALVAGGDPRDDPKRP